MHNVFRLLLFAALAVFSLEDYAQKTSIIVDTNITFIDAHSSPYNLIQPGDTVFIASGLRKFLNIKNFNGLPGHPVVFMNRGGTVVINNDHYFGILIEKCSYIRLSGAGNVGNFYGFRVEGVQHGACLSVSALTTDFEVDHLYLSGSPIGGIYAKTDPDCSFTSTRDKFTQYNTVIHDCFISNVGAEGMYVGSTKYFGQTINCNGTDTLLLPSLLSGVNIYNNIVTYTGWDGIQVSSASSNCQVHDNLVLYDSQAEYGNQMSGIILGGGSKCDCYNNYIANGKGIGIENHGLGGYRIFNNVIVNAGLTYFPNDPMKMKYGIYVDDVSVQQDSSFFILFNTIINPKTDGVRFWSLHSKNNVVVSNAIINPGAFDFYENGGFSVKGRDSYVMLPDTAADVLIEGNYFSRTPVDAFFKDTTFRLMGLSPLINAAYPDSKGISFDYDRNERPFGKASDIGAFEYMGIDTVHPTQGSDNVYGYPNPVKTLFTLYYILPNDDVVSLDLYNLKGIRVGHLLYPAQVKGKNTVLADVSLLSAGIYLYTLSASGFTESGKFVKVR